MRPMFSYFGAKWNLAKHCGQPKFSTVIEPFAGSAAYSLYWNVRDAILIDKDETICGIWSYLIAASESEIQALPIDFEHVDELKICAEAKSLIGFWITKGSEAPRRSRSAWARQFRNDTDCKVWGTAARARIASQLSGIRRWKIIPGNYFNAPNIAATWFIDPPYSVAGKRYRCSSLDIDFSKLARWCLDRKGQSFVCENTGAWLPFVHLHEARGTKGKYRTGVSSEVVFNTECAMTPNLFA